MAGRAKVAVVILLRWTVAGVFLYAGVLKALDPAEFAAQVDRYRLLPYMLSCAVGVYLPWLEILAGVALAAGIWRSGAVLLLRGMLVVFFIALSCAWARGLDIACGCFGLSGNKSNYPASFLIDVGLLAALWITTRFSKESAIRNR